MRLLGHVILGLVTSALHNNAKNANTGYIAFELNCGYHPRFFFKKNTNLYSQSKTADELSTKL